jgi:outer membrane protein assembly factor BamB
MKKKYLLLIGVMLALAVFLGGCATGLTASSWSAVTVDANNAYIASGPYVYAVNLQTGVEVWRYPAKAANSTPYYATPALTPDGQQVIVGSFDHKLYSLNPQSGAQNWVFDQAKDRWIGGVLITDDTIYAANADYNLYAISFSGAEKWVSPFQADQAIWGTPVTDGTNIYFGTLGRRVYAVNAQTGKQTWMQTVDGAVLGSPLLVASANTLYVSTYSGALVTLNTKDGTIIHQETTSSWIWSAPVLEGSHIYVGDGSGTVYAFSSSTNDGQAWTQKLNGSILGSPLAIGGTIVVGTEAGSLYFMDDTGQNIRTVYTDTGKIYATPVAALSDSLVLVAPTGGDSPLVALDLTGALKWKFTPAK